MAKAKMLLLALTVISGLLAGCSKNANTPAVETPKATQSAKPQDSPSPSPKPTVRTAELDPFVQAQKLGKGVNLGNALEAPNEGEWGLTLEESYFKTIKEGGFDTVRVPIKWSAHAGTEAPYTVDPIFFNRIDWVIEQALANKLNVVINMHHYDEIFQDPSAHQARFTAIWQQIAKRYKDKPDQVYFELLNEPHDALNNSVWNFIMKNTIDEVRKIDTHHTLIVGPSNWNGIDSLDFLTIPPEEQNVIATFHFYDPHIFTHQGAEWMTPDYGTTGILWPGPPKEPIKPVEAAEKTQWIAQWLNDYNTKPADENPSGPTPILRQLDKAAEWAKKAKRPLWVGEFGAYSKADMQSRINWTTFVRSEFEKRGFSWSYWEFASGFGVYDKGPQEWREGLLHALIPKK